MIGLVARRCSEGVLWEGRFGISMFRTEEEDMVLSERGKVWQWVQQVEKFWKSRSREMCSWPDLEREWENSKWASVFWKRVEEFAPLSFTHTPRGNGENKKRGRESVPRPGAREEARGGERKGERRQSVGDCWAYLFNISSFYFPISSLYFQKANSDRGKFSLLHILMQWRGEREERFPRLCLVVTWPRSVQSWREERRFSLVGRRRIESDSSLLLASPDMIQENIVQVKASHLPEAHWLLNDRRWGCTLSTVLKYESTIEY